MPKKAHKIAKALMREGKSEESAWRIANAQVSKGKDDDDRHKKRGKRGKK